MKLAVIKSITTSFVLIFSLGAVQVSLLLMLAVCVPTTAQMGDPSAGRTRLANQKLDPAREPGVVTLESAIHQPLPEQYIWTKADAVPADAVAAADWLTGADRDLRPHYFRRTFHVDASPAHATLYLAGPRSATIYLNGQRAGQYQLNLNLPMGIRVYACDVTGALRVGKNTLAIEAVRGPSIGSGADNRLSIQQTRGEVLALKIVPAAPGIDAPPLLVSDAQWKASMQASGDWKSAAFDDSGWPAADSLGGIESSIEFFQWNADAGMYAWPGYDGISPFLGQYHLPPMKVTDEYGGFGELHGFESLTQAHASDTELTVELPAADVSEQDAPQMMLDFGREVAGRLEIQSD